MLKCKYAGDPNDEYCKNCNGLTMMADGKELSCRECAGYEEDTTSKEVEETKQVEVEKKPEVENKVSETVTEPFKSETTKDITDTEKSSETVTAKSESNVTLPNGIKVKSLRYMSGITVVKNDIYYKFTAEEEWELPATVSDEELTATRESLWAKVNDEVDTQVTQIP